MCLFLLFFVIALGCSGLPIELELSYGEHSFRDCQVKVPEGHVLLITSGDIRQDFLLSILSDLLRPTRNTVTHCEIANCDQMTLDGQHKGIAFRWVVILYPSLLEMDTEQLLSFLVNSPNWDTSTKIVFVFEDVYPPYSALFMDLLNNFIEAGIFNIGILQPRSPCQLITSEPFSNQLRVTENTGVFDPKEGQWHYDLHGHHLTVYHVDFLFSTKLKDRQPKGAHVTSFLNLLSYWNANFTFERTSYTGSLSFSPNWTRSQVTSRFWFVPLTVMKTEQLGYITDLTSLVYEPAFEFQLLLTANKSPDVRYYIFELFLNRHSLALFSFYVLGNVIFLIYTRRQRSEGHRTSTVKHFIDTLPLCSLQPMNFTANTPTKRIFFVGFVTTVFFLSNIYNCHLTSRIIDLNIQMQIDTLQDVVNQGIPIVVDDELEKTVRWVIGQELGKDVQPNIIVTRGNDMKNISAANIAHVYSNSKNYAEDLRLDGYYAKWIPVRNPANLMSYVFPPHSPYYDDFRRIRRAYFEAGIGDVMLSNHRQLRNIMNVRERAHEYDSLQLNQILIAVRIHLTLLIGAFLVFLGEILHARYRTAFRRA